MRCCILSSYGQAQYGFENSLPLTGIQILYSKRTPVCLNQNVSSVAKLARESPLVVPPSLAALPHKGGSVFAELGFGEQDVKVLASGIFIHIKSPSLGPGLCTAGIISAIAMSILRTLANLSSGRSPGWFFPVIMAIDTRDVLTRTKYRKLR